MGLRRGRVRDELPGGNEITRVKVLQAHNAAAQGRTGAHTQRGRDSRIGSVRVVLFEVNLSGPPCSQSHPERPCNPESERVGKSDIIGR